MSSNQILVILIYDILNSDPENYQVERERIRNLIELLPEAALIVWFVVLKMT